MATVSGERRFEAPRERVFEQLLRPEVVLAPIPAVRSHRELGPDAFEATIKAPLPLAPSVKLRVEIVERSAPEHARMRGSGPGADVSSTFDLEEADGGTLMRWQTEIDLHGLLGVLGGHGLEPLARKQAERSLDAVGRALGCA
jgi:carbon monoxide dehydrogenase subunit G